MTDSVPLPPSLRKRFYEPVVLLHALKDVYRINNSLMEPDLEGSAGKSQQQTYFCFLNKLSQICDSQPKQRFGATVSAIAVLDSGTIEYRFASNQRDDAQLEMVKRYLTNIINVLGGVTDSEVRDKRFMRTVHSKILRNVLAFNRPRVESYIEALISNDRLGFCIGYAAADEANEGRYAAEALRSLQPHIEAAMNAPRLNHNEFTVHSEALLEAIHSRYESSLEDYMKQKTRDPMLNPDSPWVEVRHALGRLLSYFIAIKVLISARKFWPRLFVDFEVTSIPSSEPLEDPPEIRRTAKGIIKRMSRSTELMNAYEHHAGHLQSQSHRLDDRIRDRARRGYFTPIVHAEVNLLESVLRSRAAAERDGEAPLRFFNEAEFGAYLGTSKPPCLLCGLYFAAHPEGVRVRESHGNLYINWRAPDLSVNAGADPIRQRCEILEAMVKEVRNHAGRAIRDRSYTRKNHDSCTTPTNPLWSTTIDELASAMGQISLDVASTTAVKNEPPEITPGVTRPTINEDGDDDDNDDDEGGALL
ncbi:hypothetical protein P885DRAFT_72227 [Corynascus similis CBS 632.67]